jgi:signal transduction histidine kinase
VPNNNIQALHSNSLIGKFVRYALFIVTFIVFASAWLSIDYYKVYNEEQQEYTRKEAQKIVFMMDEKISFADHILRYIGNRVKESPDKSDEGINKILKHHKKVFEGKNILWRSINYVTPDGYLIADSRIGLLPKRIYIAPGKRDWLVTAHADGWSIKYSKPDIGIISHDYVLSSAVGITERDIPVKKFWGYLVVGFNIEQLAESLKSTTPQEIGFVAFDKDGNFVLSSTPTLNIKNTKIDKEIINSVTGTAKLAQPISMGDYLFTHASHSKMFPITIFVGLNKKFTSDSINRNLLPRLLIYSSTCLVFIIILSIIGYKVLNPIIMLNKMALSISQGSNYEPLESDIMEFRNLSKQLTRISLITRDLRIKQQLLSKSNHDLENANTFIKSNMSFLSHELINPVSAIIGFTDLLKEKLKINKDTEVHEYVELIHKASVHQNQQLNFFLSLFKFQESKRRLELKAISLKELIDWNVSMVRHQAKNKGIKITINVAKNLKMMGDEIMIGQLIQNFTSNGVKYNKQNGNLFVRAFSDNKNDIVLEFEDSGIGISKDDISKIFKKFGRVKETNKTIGYGIGLAYAKQCVLAHNGKIRIKSKLGVGTKFIITFLGAYKA